MHHTRRLIAVVSAIVLCAGLSGCGLFSSGDDDGGDDGGVGSPCTTNAECGEAFVCAGGTCQLEGSVGLGGNCSANRDCGTDLFCTAQGVCGPAGGGAVGDPCATGAECEKDLTCVVFGFGGTCEEAGSGDLGAACGDTGDCIAGLACANDGTCKAPADAFPPFTGVECGPAEAPFRIYFEVPRDGNPPADFFRLPFPNDARVDASGNLDMSDFPRPGPSFLGVDIIDLYADALERDFTGFSSTAAVTFRFSDQLEFSTIGDGSANMHYIDITPSTPEYNSDRGRRYSYTTGRGLYVCEQAFTVANDPERPLLPNHTYAVYITTDIRSANNEPPAQDADFAAVLSSTRPTGDPELENAWDKYQLFRDWLTDQGIAANTIAGAAVFTVQDTTGPLERLYDDVANNVALPTLSNLTLCDGATTSPCDDGGVRTCGDSSGNFYEIHGRFSVPIYQQGTTPYALPSDGGNIVFNSSGIPQQVSTTDVCMVLNIPKTTKPVSGWPFLVYAHGTGGSFKGVVTNGVAAELASNGIASMSFDGVVHGERRAGHTRDSDSLMFNVINPAAARDNNIQGGVDVFQALRVAQVSTFNVAGVGDIDFDASNVFYFGHSQGSNVGVPATAVSPEAKCVIYSGAGAFLSQGILNKTSPVNAKAGLEFLVGEPLSTSHPLMTIWQTFFDSSDPVNYAPLVLVRPPSGVQSKHVFMTWASDDTFSPKPTLNTMARTLQIPVATPVVENIMGLGMVVRPVSLNKTAADGQRTAAVFQYQSNGFDGHFVSTRVAGAVSDWSGFLTSCVSGTPSVQ